MSHENFEQLQILFQSHIKSCEKKLGRVLKESKASGFVFDSGVPYYYFSDDQHAPFRSNPYFKYFCPLNGESHLLCFDENKGFELFVYEPASFWSDISYGAEEDYWSKFFKISYLRSETERDQVLAAKKSWVYVGKPHDKIENLDLKVNPKEFLSALNWWRSQKSDYEIFCLDEANRRGAKAHKRVRELFYAENPSEYILNMEYLKAIEDSGEDLPYHSIVAHNEKAAILHYQYKRAQSKGRTLLIDSGASFLSYGSDITRTYIQKNEDTSLFAELLSAMEVLQQKLCSQVEEGKSFVALQVEMHYQLADLLLDHGILKSCSRESAFETGLTSLFCPHGLGHMLGLQVHDVGGSQADEAGSDCEKDPRMPHARMNRSLRENEVVTVEPGLYFIPSLLEERKTSEESSNLNWGLIENLIPLGGIRIEDNIVVRGNKPFNLTRQYL